MNKAMTIEMQLTLSRVRDKKEEAARNMVITEFYNNIDAVKYWTAVRRNWAIVISDLIYIFEMELRGER